MPPAILTDADYRTIEHRAAELADQIARTDPGEQRNELTRRFSVLDAELAAYPATRRNWQPPLEPASVMFTTRVYSARALAAALSEHDHSVPSPTQRDEPQPPAASVSEDTQRIPGRSAAAGRNLPDDGLTRRIGSVRL